MSSSRTTKNGSGGFFGGFWKGFLQFKVEIHEEELKSGRYLTMDQVNEKATAKWARFSNENREQYNRKYNESNVGARMAAIQASEQARESEQVSEKIQEEEGTRSGILKVIADNKWQDQLWCIISATNYFRGDKAYPGELAMAMFSLKRGISDTLHVRIHPGDLPTGANNAARATSDEFHHLPLPPNCGDEAKDFKLVLDKIQTFIAGNVGMFPTMFTDQGDKGDEIDEVRSALQRIYHEGKMGDGMPPRVAALDKLFYLLQSELASASNRTAFTSANDARKELFKNADKYTDAGCNFHKQEDVLNYCCDARVKRWAYQIILHCSASQVIPSAQQQPKPPESSSSSDSDRDLTLMLLELSDKSGCELSDDKLGSENDEPKTYTISKFDFDSML